MCSRDGQHCGVQAGWFYSWSLSWGGGGGAGRVGQSLDRWGFLGIGRFPGNRVIPSFCP